MADHIAAKFDFGSLLANLTQLSGDAAESLARRMCVSGGVILRDEARNNALISFAKTSWIPNPKSRGSESAGELADAIYLSKDEANSNGTRFTYKVSWNAEKAWWGKLREFGYHMLYKVYKDAQGAYHVNFHAPLANPRWMGAHPILAPAFDGNIGRVREAMIARGREEIPKLLHGGDTNVV